MGFLNEKGEVLGWRLTKSTKFSEIEDLLKGIKQRLDSKDKTINMVCVDNCCNVRNKYTQIFSGTEVKLDLFHACQRIKKTLNKAETTANSFMREFSQIFRRDDDQGSARLKYTPAKGQLEKNLNSLIERWINVPNSPLGNSQTTREIEHLRLHIQKGCLSHIPPGCGTERNEQLHRLLNRSLITGATRISVELAIALLSVLFYYHTTKLSAFRHDCNAKVVPIVPVNNIDNLQHDNSPHPPFTTGSLAVEEQTDETLGEPASHSDMNPEVTITETITDLCTYYVARSIINVACNIQEIISNVDAQSCNRAFDCSSLLYLLKFSNLLHLDDTTESNDPNISTHTEDLKRHLAEFGLKS